MYVAQGVLDARLGLFCQSMTDVKQEVRSALEGESHHNCVERLIDKEVMKKPSVTLAMITLSFFFVCAWAVVFLMSLLRP